MISSIANHSLSSTFDLSGENLTRLQLENIKTLLEKLPHEGEFDERLVPVIAEPLLRERMREFVQLATKHNKLEQICAEAIGLPNVADRHEEVAELARIAAYLDISENQVGDAEEIGRIAQSLHQDWQRIKDTCDEVTGDIQVSAKMLRIFNY